MQFFRLNLKIYNLKDIKKAIEDYRSLVEIRYNLEENNTVILKLINCNDEDFQIIKNEFCNYVIGLVGKHI
ncbi:HxsD-like protein [Clostridium autoethanogenum]|uniref:HxsD-like protein n=1 Tax=Clostridium autoethanogenum DSM 10061 TaxID=1341692 RepID=A0ABN4BJ24_9CLOT|nr:HxsD-like protein [Clostridium autoethanogenum]AGY77736.1 HxsD-like protein [Clostridium autoethanogenum DSM 10061]ALU37872.1 hypothetical protein CLAU_3445 [Clostridium autoethanogenum DSM 10061]OVY49777.1 hypothetical protein WX72_03156 [Clostridium autoethanogenum]